MKKHKEIKFDAETLVRSVEEFVEHLQGRRKLTLRVTTITIPEPVKPMKPREIGAIRRRLNMSQAVFAAMLNVPPATERSWEKGRRRPTGAALRLLDLVRRKPEVLLEDASSRRLAA